MATALSEASDATMAAVALGLMMPFSGMLNGEVHADPIAALAFVPLSLAGLLVGRGLTGPEPLGACLRRCAILTGAGLVLTALLAGEGIAFNKVTGSSSFVAVSAAFAAALLATVAAVEAVSGALPVWLAEVGRSANAWVLQ